MKKLETLAIGFAIISLILTSTRWIADSTKKTEARGKFSGLRRHTATLNQSRLQYFSGWWRRIRERRELPTLSDRELADFMCSRADARAEANKWFWEA